jgi:prepilin signal peptidase PulO-like enzyme (type II secretory pathway)
MEIPDEVSIPAAVIVFAINVIVSKNLETFLFGGTIGALFFLVQFIISKGNWIGGGDIRLGLLMGVLFGPYGVIVAIFLSYMTGALYSLPLLFKKYFNKKEDINSALPLAPFLVIGSLIVLFFGDIVLKILK